MLFVVPGQGSDFKEEKHTGKTSSKFPKRKFRFFLVFNQNSTHPAFAHEMLTEATLIQPCVGLDFVAHIVCTDVQNQ